MENIKDLKEEMKSKLTKNEIKKLNKLNLFYIIFDENFTLNSILKIFNLIYHGKYDRTNFIKKNLITKIEYVVPNSNYSSRKLVKSINKIKNNIFINQKLRDIIFEYIWKKIDFDFINNVKNINDYKLIFDIFLKSYFITNLVSIKNEDDFFDSSFNKVYMILEDEFIQISLKINFKDEFLSRFLFLRILYMEKKNYFDKYKFPPKYIVPYNKEVLNFPAKEIKNYLEKKEND